MHAYSLLFHSLHELVKDGHNGMVFSESSELCAQFLVCLVCKVVVEFCSNHHLCKYPLLVLVTTAVVASRVIASCVLIKQGEQSLFALSSQDTTYIHMHVTLINKSACACDYSETGCSNLDRRTGVFMHVLLGILGCRVYAVDFQIMKNCLSSGTIYPHSRNFVGIITGKCMYYHLLQTSS